MSNDVSFGMSGKSHLILYMLNLHNGQPPSNNSSAFADELFMFDHFARLALKGFIPILLYHLALIVFFQVFHTSNATASFIHWFICLFSLFMFTTSKFDKKGNRSLVSKNDSIFSLKFSTAQIKFLKVYHEKVSSRAVHSVFSFIA